MNINYKRIKYSIDLSSTKISRIAIINAIFVVGLWIPFYVIYGLVMLSIFQIFCTALFIICYILTYTSRITSAIITAQFTGIIYIIIYCIFVEGQEQDLMRTTHLYLLIITLVGYANYLRENNKLQLIIIAVSLVLFVLFSTFHLEPGVLVSMPPTIKLVGAWVDSLTVAFTLSAGVYLLNFLFNDDIRKKAELREALISNEFLLLYQPQFDRFGSMCGAEALIRWKHPFRGFIQPSEFIPTSERTGFITELDEWVLESAIKTLSRWSCNKKLRKIAVAVNVSALSFFEDGFVDNILKLLDEYNVLPSRLKLELTETILVTEMDQLNEIMNELHSHGISIALDDFGTGYASLNYLRNLPFSQIKIDRSFLLGLEDGEHGLALVINIVKIGQDLGLEVLAEGVENAEQIKILIDCGCTKFQGYYFGRPMPADLFEEFNNECVKGVGTRLVQNRTFRSN